MSILLVVSRFWEWHWIGHCLWTIISITWKSHALIISRLFGVFVGPSLMMLQKSCAIIGSCLDYCNATFHGTYVWKKTLRNSSMSEQWSTNRLCRKLTTTKSTATTLLVVCSVRNWLQTSNIVLQVADDRGSLFTSMGVSSCSSLGWPAGGHICIWGGARIPEVLMHDWVNGVIWHQLCDATLCVQLLCNLATLQPVSLGGGTEGGTVLTGAVPPDHPLKSPLFI